MFGFFKTDRVQDIIKQYPHPVDQFTLFLREGHTAAAEEFINCYTDIFTQELIKGVNEANRNKEEFGTDDSINISGRIAERYWANPSEPRQITNTAKDIEAMNQLIDSKYDKYSDLEKAWSRRCIREKIPAEEEAQKRPLEIINVQNQLKILGELSYKMNVVEEDVARPSIKK